MNQLLRGNVMKHGDCDCLIIVGAVSYFKVLIE